MQKLDLTVTPEWSLVEAKGESPKLWLHWDFKNVSAEEIQINLYNFNFRWTFQAALDSNPTPTLTETQQPVIEHAEVPPQRADFPVIKAGGLLRRSVWIWGTEAGKINMALPSPKTSSRPETKMEYVFTKPGSYRGIFCIELLPSQAYKVNWPGPLCTKSTLIQIPQPRSKPL